ncbi:hypothetical protein [Intestinimonas timonensis]|uniref:hypothetical protein n=1 Tax=Intestinimonas timonensis TaxID=1689270 RepID=UPI0024B181A6|nr:hypothetical protein [Intestinimonas timonensis]
MKNAALSRALKWLFIAQLLSIVALLPLVYNLRSLLGAAAGLLTLAALVRAAREESGYRTALVLCVANLVLGALSSVLLRWFIYFLIRMLGTWAVQIVGALSALLSIAGMVLGLLILRQVCLTTAGLVDDPAVAARGIRAWRINLICTVAVLLLTAAVSALLKIGLDMEKLLGLSTAVTLLSAVAQLAARVLYLHFLWQSARCLSARD